MATYVASGSAMVDPFSAQRADVLSGVTSGCTLVPGMAVFMDANGKLNPSTTSSTTGYGITKFDGLVSRSYVANDVATVFSRGARFNYSTGMTIGQELYITASGSQLGTVALQTVSGSQFDLPVAKAVSATDIVIIR